jgi:cytoskeletal protein CcmA (bactofilin family)
MNIIQLLRIARIRIFLSLCALVLLPMLLAVSPVWSSNVETQKPAIVGATQVIDDDLYLAGETVTIDGTVKGDAVLAGKQVTVNGNVEGDLIAAGQVITLNGTVRDDVRIAGQVLILDNKARVGDDLIAAGASLENKAGSTVGGNLNFIGAQALLAGTVKQNVQGGMNSLELRGSVGQNMQVTTIGDPNPLEAPFIPTVPVTIPNIPLGLTLTDTAKIGGKLIYQSTRAAQISQKAQVASAVVREELSHDRATSSSSSPVWIAQPPTPAQIVLERLQRLVALILVGWLVMRFVPGLTQSLAATVQAKPLPSLGWGVVTCVGVVVTAIAIAFTTLLLMFLLALFLPNLIPAIFGMGILANLSLAIGFGIIASYLPQIIVSFLGGRWLLQQLRPETSSRSFVALVVGLVAFVVLTAIPVLGWLVSLISVLLGLGAIWIWGRSKRDRVPEPQLATV